MAIDRTVAQRVKRLREKNAASGIVRLEVTVPVEFVSELKAFATELRSRPRGECTIDKKPVCSE